MINLELYRIFYVVAEAGNITKASQKLNISQPAVTKHIKNLEDTLGTTLFIRTKKGVVLTEIGQNMFIYIKQSLSLINEAEKSFSNFKKLDKGTIKIGISTNLTRNYLLKYLDIFHRQYPNIIVEISTDPTSELIKLLKVGTLDFIVAKLPRYMDNDLKYEKLGELEDVFVVNKEYKKLVDKKLKIADILEYPILLQKQPSNSRETIDMYCKENNLTIHTIMNIASSNLLIDFVKIGYGIGFITKQYIEDELNNNELFILDITPKIKANSFGIITLKNSVLSFSTQKFRDIIMK